MYPRIFAFLTVVIVLTAPLCAQEVVGFTLIDASTNQEIRPLRDGDTIDFKTEGAELNNFGRTSGENVGSVRFELNGGQRTETETAPPYSIGGDRRGDYDAWTPSPGEVSADGHPVRRRERRTGQGQDDRLYGRRNAKTGRRFARRSHRRASSRSSRAMWSWAPFRRPTGGTGAVEGDLMEWHGVRITFDGPSSSETAKVNPFLHYRLNVTFTNGGENLRGPRLLRRRRKRRRNLGQGRQ